MTSTPEYVHYPPKPGATIAIRSYSSILNENEILPFVNRFYHRLFESIIERKEDPCMPLQVEVYGELIGLGGINISSNIGDTVDHCMESLSKSEKKY